MLNGLLSTSVVFLCSFDADVDDMDEDEAIDDIENPEVFICTTFCLPTQLNEHVRTQVLTPQCPHLFNTTTYETTRLLLHVLIYLQFRSGRLCNHTTSSGYFYRFICAQ